MARIVVATITRRYGEGILIVEEPHDNPTIFSKFIQKLRLLYGDTLKCTQNGYYILPYSEYNFKTVAKLKQEMLLPPTDPKQIKLFGEDNE